MSPFPHRKQMRRPTGGCVCVCVCEESVGCVWELEVTTKLNSVILRESDVCQLTICGSTSGLLQWRLAGILRVRTRRVSDGKVCLETYSMEHLPGRGQSDKNTRTTMRCVCASRIPHRRFQTNTYTPAHTTACADMPRTGRDETVNPDPGWMRKMKCHRG